MARAARRRRGIGYRASLVLTLSLLIVGAQHQRDDVTLVVIRVLPADADAAPPFPGR